uniref:Uncharacterized protein n=1 Tax=Octactis speculum TaxID=3111310 RepID=A0A7S2MTQ6_9STRA|mmetsp:Transcript_9914/g.12931  ORF Transcript_9914/g.12931 Transcript_9914/m.12931 type:complete len:123 (+) Transcript_9914:682-1050(+)
MAGSVADAKSVEVPPFATTDANGTNASSAAVLPSVNMGVEELLVNSVAEHLYVSTAANVTNASHAEGAPSASMAVAGTTVRNAADLLPHMLLRRWLLFETLFKVVWTLSSHLKKLKKLLKVK